MYNDQVLLTRPFTVEQAIKVARDGFSNETHWVDKLVQNTEALSALESDVQQIASDLEKLLKLAERCERDDEIPINAMKRHRRLSVKTSKMLSRLLRFVFQNNACNPLQYDDFVFVCEKMSNYRAAVRKLKHQWRALDIKVRNRR
jgi:hypothetical protein